MDFAELQEYYNRCKLEESLDPDDPRNVDFDNVPEEERPRGTAWVERIEHSIALASDPMCLLLTGLPGSGKTTELRRLKKRLQDRLQGGRRLFPVLIDAEKFVDLSAGIDIPDLLLGIVYEVERHVLEAEGKSPDDAGQEGPIKRLWNWLNTEVEVNKLSLPIPGGVLLSNLTVELKNQPSFREQVRKAAASRLSAFRQNVCAEIDTLMDRVKKLSSGYDSMVIIVDSLEKLRGSSSTWVEVLESAEQVFQGGAPHLRLPVHALYTVPAALISRNVRDIKFMPMVKIREIDGQTPFEPGIHAMRKLVAQRIPDSALQQMLGDNYEERVREAISCSAGYPRDLLRFLREILISDRFPISDLTWKRIRHGIFDEYRAQVVADAFEWLAEVHRDKYITAANNEQRQAADRMLLSNVVLHYCNAESWYDLHPALLEVPGLKRAIEALSAPPG